MFSSVERAVATVLADHDLSAMAVHVPNVHQRHAKVSTILITDPATSAFGLDHISPAHGRRCSAHCHPSLFFDNAEKNVGSASSFVVTSIPSRSNTPQTAPLHFWFRDPDLLVASHGPRVAHRSAYRFQNVP